MMRGPPEDDYGRIEHELQFKVIPELPEEESEAREASSVLTFLWNDFMRWCAEGGKGDFEALQRRYFSDREEERALNDRR
jgi:hypothetical protein